MDWPTRGLAAFGALLLAALARLGWKIYRF